MKRQSSKKKRASSWRIESRVLPLPRARSSVLSNGSDCLNWILGKVWLIRGSRQCGGHTHMYTQMYKWSNLKRKLAPLLQKFCHSFELNYLVHVCQQFHKCCCNVLKKKPLLLFTTVSLRHTNNSHVENSRKDVRKTHFCFECMQDSSLDCICQCDLLCKNWTPVEFLLQQIGDSISPE